MMQFCDVPVYLHREVVDFRKSINGLSVIVEESLLMSPMQTGLFVFCNRRRDKLKVLYWDSTGYCLWYKRLEDARFKWPRQGENKWVLTQEQFDWLLRGFDISQIQAHSPLFFGENDPLKA